MVLILLAPRSWRRRDACGSGRCPVARGGARPSAHSAALALRGRVGPSLAIGGVEMVRAALLLSLACMQAQGNMYDVFERHKLPPVECAHGCAAWADAAEARPELNITAMWAVSGKVPVEAGKYCAIPGMVGGRDGRVWDERYDDVEQLFAGTWPATHMLDLEPGDLVMFNGLRSMHRVRAVHGSTNRMIAVMSYDTKPGFSSTDAINARLYGPRCQELLNTHL